MDTNKTVEILYISVSFLVTYNLKGVETIGE